MMEIYDAISALIGYGLECGLIEEQDIVYCENRLCDVLKLGYYERAEYKKAELEDILKAMLDYAAENGIIENTITYRDLFDTRIMDCITPRPSQVIKKFADDIKEGGIELATDNYYKFSRDTDYIRRYRIKNDVKWVYKSKYGDIDITINLSKPEKDPAAIAAAKNAKGGPSYPKCALCRECEGFSGSITKPARNTHRIIPIELCGKPFFFQYSPYVYYNEHCIVLSGEHTPMIIDRAVFEKLLDFTDKFPHYFAGSNADLPIVGGSILAHEHFQGGRYDFAMAKAGIRQELSFNGFEDVSAGIVNWPMSVIRISGKDKARLAALADKILTKWRSYTDEKAMIYAETDGTPHNTITPIARRRGELFELDLVLRNNLTTEEYPMGVYHAHPEYHHLKKENIGLIEVMGLAVLPSRLKLETELLKKALLSGTDIADDEVLSKHKAWADELTAKYSFTEDNIDGILRDEIGKVFVSILENCGVFFGDDDAFIRFAKTV